MSDQKIPSSKPNQTDEENQEQLANFFDMLTNNFNPSEADEEDKVNDSASVDIDSTESIEHNQDKPNNDGNADAEIGVLQDLLVGPHVNSLKKRVRKLEQKCVDLETTLQEKEQLIEAIIPAISQLLTNQLTDLKQEMLAEIALMVNKFVEENGQQPQKLSIQVMGLRKDAS